MTAAERELERKLLREYARARATLLDGFSFPSGKGFAENYIQQTLLTCSAKQAEIMLTDLSESFLSGVYIESDILRDKVPAYTGVDLKRISKTHLNRITKDAIGDIGNFNTVVETNLVKQHRELLSNNELVNQITKHGWTKETEKRILDAGFDKKVLHLAKQQTTTPKMIKILEMHGIRGGMHPDEVSKLLQPHIRDVFGDGGVLIDNTGKLRNRFIVDADGKYKWVTQEVKEKYRATVKTYSETIARSSMVQTHVNGRTETLKQSGLVEKYRSIANMTANTCPQCAMMHGQIIDPNEGPLYHPNCSCRRAPVWKKETGLMNHTDEFYENQRNEHFWKQHQLKEYNKTLPKGDKIPNYNFLPKDKLTGMPGKEEMRKIRSKMLGEAPEIQWTDAKVGDTLWKETSIDGKEHAIIKNGETVYLKGTKNSCAVPDMPTTPFEFHHSHPNWDSPLSADDVGLFLTNRENKVMAAYSKNHIYKITKRADTHHVSVWTPVRQKWEMYADDEMRRLRKQAGIGTKKRAPKLWRQAIINTNKKFAEQLKYDFEVIPR